MAIETVPEWMAGLEDEDVAFIKKFLLASGSLKEVAGLYGVTYPTVRLRLDRLIQKIHLSEDTAADPYVWRSSRGWPWRTSWILIPPNC